eukprot:944392-Alexandrium_andersonii.AAC.1
MEARRHEDLLERRRVRRRLARARRYRRQRDKLLAISLEKKWFQSACAPELMVVDSRPTADRTLWLDSASAFLTAKFDDDSNG